MLEPDIETVEISRNQVLYDTGDAMHHAYFPHNSIISLVNVLEDGSSTEVAGFGYEGVMGLLSGLVTREAFGRYVVVTSGSASRISVERLERGENHPSWASAIDQELRRSSAGTDVSDRILQCGSWSGRALQPLDSEHS